MKVTMVGSKLGTTLDSYKRKSSLMLLTMGRESFDEFQAACNYAMSKGTFHGMIEVCYYKTGPFIRTGPAARDAILVTRIVKAPTPSLGIVFQVKDGFYPSAAFLANFNKFTRDRVRDMRRIAKQLTQR